jgi:hypothetical protein
VTPIKRAALSAELRREAESVLCQPDLLNLSAFGASVVSHSAESFHITKCGGAHAAVSFGGHSDHTETVHSCHSAGRATIASHETHQ